ncbi:hypothetical protein B0H11DRAFT_2079818 [Mycena galericulata]|nr:hypothetical protein B0H11DRAFT_2079818 [Mycena galericulata]
MPEAQVIPLFAHDYEKYQRAFITKHGQSPSGRLQLFPRTFAEGTKSKPWETLSVDNTDLPAGFFAQPERDYPINEFDALRASKKGCAWKYLIDREHRPGPVHVTFRGKSLAFTVGEHILVVHFHLEGNARLVSRGSLRSFPLPARFITPGSSTSPRTINVLAAIKMEKMAIIISDFSRMARLHVISSTRIFDSPDLDVGSEMWKTRLWSHFPSGPDWVKEPEEALIHMDNWRNLVLAKASSTNRTAEGKVPGTMLNALCHPLGPAAGVGAHLANNILYLLRIHVDTPPSVICRNEAYYQAFRAFMPRFMLRWVSPEFKKRCGGRVNSTNPFDFNYKSNTNFLGSFDDVFHREEVKVPRDLYNAYQADGLFDETHIIGETYLKAWTPITTAYKIVKVLHTGKKKFHIIRAQPPASWNCSAHQIPFTDVSNAGYVTTIGVASFREVILNKIDPARAMENLRPGRPRKEKTGQRGRPRKATTKAKLEKIKKSVKHRFRTRLETEIEEDDIEEDVELECFDAMVVDTGKRVTRASAKVLDMSYRI